MTDTTGSTGFTGFTGLTVKPYEYPMNYGAPVDYTGMTKYGGGPATDFNTNFAANFDAGAVNSPSAATTPKGWLANLLSSPFQTENDQGDTIGGWAQAGLGTFTALTNAWLGMKQYGMAKDALQESKRQFNLNYGAAKKAYNNELEDRTKARLGYSSGQGESVADAVKKFGV